MSVSIIVPSRNEQFLSETVDDLLEKSKGDIEIIVVLEGYWPDPPLKDDNRVVILHRGRARGLREAVNSSVEIASKKFIMKTDAHCMFKEGFDVALAKDCEKDWISIPRRYSLNPEDWCRREKHHIDYLYVESPTKSSGDLAGKVWGEKNYDLELNKILIDDLMTFQGSCWFMHKDYFFFLDKFDEKNYGTFRKEPQEISFKCWLSGGRVVRNKKTWYAHLHKGRKYGRGYHANKKDHAKGDEYNKKWATNSAWNSPKQIKDFKWLVDKFNPPGWEDYKW